MSGTTLIQALLPRRASQMPPTRIEALATAWSSRVEPQSQQLYQMGATISGMLGSLPL